jgi:hypothetical protein
LVPLTLEGPPGSRTNRSNAGTRAKAISYEGLVGVLRDLCSDNPAATIDETVKTKLNGLLKHTTRWGEDPLDANETLHVVCGRR